MKIGITGHQTLNENYIPWIEAEIVKDIKSLGEVHHAFSSLAIGADQLFASIILEMNIELTAVIPCQDYETTFNSIDKKNYYALLSRCANRKELNFESPSETAFYAAGIYISEVSDVLFAIWDGFAAKGLGGTGDVVNFALLHKKLVIHLNPNTKLKTIHNGK